jgi:hypothetical protein
MSETEYGSPVNCRCFVEPIEKRQVVNPTRPLPGDLVKAAAPTERWERSDLDRCLHGRHSTDPCWGCPGGQSEGNLFVSEGLRIGTNLYGEPIYVVPNRRVKSD